MDKHDPAVGTTALEEEIAHLRERIAKLEADRRMLAFILDSIPDYVSYVSADLVYQECNKKYEFETGRPREAFIGNHVIAFMGEEGLAKIQPYVERVLSGEAVSYEDRIDYRYMAQQDVEVRYTPQRTEEGVVGFSVYVRNITAQRRAEAMLLRKAHHDSLTDLPNRTFFFERLEQALGRAGRFENRLAVLFIDLDGFKQVNDVFGHEAGDQVLQNVANKLRGTIRRNDTLARIGGDEFILLVEDIKDLGQVTSLADKIIQLVSNQDNPILGTVRIGASIGVAIYPDHGLASKELVVRADKAMYEAKRAGKGNYFIYKT